MNDRIIEMAIEAGFNPVNCTGSNVPLFNKFAELIIKECTGFLRDNLDDQFAAEQLEDYFEVEE